MQSLSTTPVKTFTIGVHDPELDESSYARRVASHLGTDHTELFVTPESALAVIPKLPQLFDEPFADSSQIPTFLVSELARHHVTVSLSGDGGDELFAGYEQRYLYAQRLWSNLSRLPQSLRGGAAKICELLSEAQWDGIARAARAVLPQRWIPSHAGRKAKKFARLLSQFSPNALYAEILGQWDPHEIVIGASLPPTILTTAHYVPPLETFLDQMMYIDQSSYLIDDIMVKVDRASMGVGLEAREPLLDYRIVAAAWALPLSLKTDGTTTKIALRKILSRYLPNSLIDRPKRGFAIPIDSWLRGPLRDWAGDLLNEATLRSQGFLMPGAITTKWQQHLSGSHSWHYLLWNVLMFQAWLDASR